MAPRRAPQTPGLIDHARNVLAQSAVHQPASVSRGWKDRHGIVYEGERLQLSGHHEDLVVDLDILNVTRRTGENLSRALRPGMTVLSSHKKVSGQLDKAPLVSVSAFQAPGGEDTSLTGSRGLCVASEAILLAELERLRKGSANSAISSSPWPAVVRRFFAL